MTEPAYSLYGGQPPHQPHSTTSLAAAESIRDQINGLQHRVYCRLMQAGERGLIDEELIESFSGIGQARANAVRPRRIELAQMGLVRDSGRTRKTSKNRDAVVWVAVPPDQAVPPPVKQRKCSCPAPPFDSCRRVLDSLSMLVESAPLFSPASSADIAAVDGWIRTVNQQEAS